jgi:hypothetical protein
MINWKLWRSKSSHATLLIRKRVISGGICYIGDFKEWIAWADKISDLIFKTSKNFPHHDFDMADSSEPVAIEFLSTALALWVELKQW